MKKILSLGAGVQSSTMLLMSLIGETERPDCAIFADTQCEPRKVYEHLAYLKTIAEKFSFPIYEVTNGNLLSDKWCKIPAFTNMNGRAGIIRRQCTKDYKLRAIYEAARRVAGLEKGQRTKSPAVEMWLGISTDEATRMRDSPEKWKINRYPLIEKMMSRSDCLKWLAENQFKAAPKSSCIICPFHSDFFWKDLYFNSPDEFEEACLYDEKIRNSTKRGLHAPIFLHRSLKPLRELPFINLNQKELFQNECSGVCGV